MKTALLVIDIQNDYFPGGKMELAEMSYAAENSKRIISHFRKNNWPVIFIKHLAVKPTAAFFIPDSAGAEIHESVRPLDTETVIIKNFPNSFRNTSLHQKLQFMQVSDLVICGAMTHMCVDTTTRAANDLGYLCTIITDACAARDLTFNGQVVCASEVQLAYMAAINGSFGMVISTNEYIESVESD